MDAQRGEWILRLLPVYESLSGVMRTGTDDSDILVSSQLELRGNFTSTALLASAASVVAKRSFLGHVVYEQLESVNSTMERSTITKARMTSKHPLSLQL